MSQFVGTWNTMRMKDDGTFTAEPIQITIKIDENTSEPALEGRYPRPGIDASLIGSYVEGTNYWKAQFQETASPSDQGTVLFVLSEDFNTLHGAWTSQNFPFQTQPWYGTRVQ